MGHPAMGRAAGGSLRPRLRKTDLALSSYFGFLTLAHIAPIIE